MNKFPWGHSRRFNAYTQYLQQKYGARIQKISLDVGFTCPNRNGSSRSGGCTFCDNQSFTPSYCHPDKPVSLQIQEGIEFHRFRYRRVVSYLAYFQAYSNTFASLDKLEKLYEEALAQPGVIGLVIGTRPDCISSELLNYLSSLINQGKIIILEYGIESVYDRTLERVNRGHNMKTTEEAIRMTHAAGIPCAGHLIMGLPGESEEEILHSVDVINKLPLNYIKFHQLQLMKGTAMVQDYLDHPQDFRFFSMDEYIRFMVKYLEKLRPDMVIERFASEIPGDFNVSPVIWDIRYDEFLRRMEIELEAQDSWQGKYYHPNA